MRTPLARLTRLCRPVAEFSKIAQATSVGFAIMGFIGFFVKLIFIPINKSDIMRFEPQTCVPLTWCAANILTRAGPTLGQHHRWHELIRPLFLFGRSCAAGGAQSAWPSAVTARGPFMLRWRGALVLCLGACGGCAFPGPGVSRFFSARLFRRTRDKDPLFHALTKPRYSSFRAKSNADCERVSFGRSVGRAESPGPNKSTQWSSSPMTS